jgi:hypothetical protein
MRTIIVTLTDEEAEKLRTMFMSDYAKGRLTVDIAAMALRQIPDGPNAAAERKLITEKRDTIAAFLPIFEKVLDALSAPVSTKDLTPRDEALN